MAATCALASARGSPAAVTYSGLWLPPRRTSVSAGVPPMAVLATPPPGTARHAVGAENHGVAAVRQGVHRVQILHEMHPSAFGEPLHHRVIVDDGMVDGDRLVLAHGGLFHRLNRHDDARAKAAWFGEINPLNHVGMIGEGGVSE